MDKKVLIFIVLIIIISFALIMVYPSSDLLLSPQEAEVIFGGNWEVVRNDTNSNSIGTITMYYANSTNITSQQLIKVESIEQEVLVGDVNNTNVEMIIVVVKFSSNISWNEIFTNNSNYYKYDGYYIIYSETSFTYSKTIIVAYNDSTLIEITLNGYKASLSQIRELISKLAT
ncbi:MAG: hypothetical protein QXY87_10335 [Saccharolobus sp.]|uniref:Uncharacterized protein n=1 Tax=Saccharolobus shibatae (strain ATCC 51178 / DSM 5389 / JCM 8931 / NBRC 15437 / B12) TaxID=523848 RepID=A0A8F5BPZ1_SACSH|nr:hypothetical protein [Saccharolobus shibatae]MCH4816493.1 hypothetical protein [Saccharolobus shibatae]QXJ29316.1 hypothetical protein J5U23_02185 [Saccharolobus shibatae B12]